MKSIHQFFVITLSFIFLNWNLLFLCSSHVSCLILNYLISNFVYIWKKNVYVDLKWAISSLVIYMLIKILYIFVIYENYSRVIEYIFFDSAFLCVLSIHHSFIVQGRLWKMYRNQLIRFYQIHFCLSRVFSSCNLNEV